MPSKTYLKLVAYDAALREKHGPVICGVDEAGRGCEAEDAEILTRRGWLSCHQITKDDVVLSRSGDGVLAWQEVEEVILKPYDGDIVEMSNGDGLSVRVTTDHCFDVLRRVSKGKKVVGYRSAYVPLSDVKDNDCLPRTGDWHGDGASLFILPGAERGKMDTQSIQADRPIPMRDWVAFLGLYLAEGCCVKEYKGNYRVRIAQFKAENETVIQAMLDALPFKFRRTRQVFECQDKALWLHLSALGNCYTKFVPDYVRELPADDLSSFLDWFLLGDGNSYQHTGGRKPFVTAYTSSPRLRDGLEEVVIKTGRSFTTTSRMRVGAIEGRSFSQTVPAYRIVIKTERHASFKWLRKAATLTPYVGNVFCLRLPMHHNFCVRRNGRAYFTGNSWAGPIAAGAVILPPDACIVGMNDSKLIKDPAKREALADEVRAVALGWSVQMIGPEEIDSKGIQWANMEVMRRAAEEAAQRAGLTVDLYVIDQSPCKSLNPHIMLAKADGTSQCVASGAILAKTTRDALMAELGEKHPEYNLAGNDGYVRPEHVDAVNKYGLVKGLHRFTWNVKGMVKPISPTYDLDLIF